MSTEARTFLTPDEYLEYERKTGSRNEYHDGESFPVEAATYAHAVITANLSAATVSAAHQGGCTVLTSSLRVFLHQTGTYVYPDLTIVCGTPLFADKLRDTLTNPKIIFKVLSPTTGDYDRGAKFAAYRQVPSLSEYITIAQDSYQVEHCTRQSDQRWLLTDIEGLDATLHLESIGLDVPLSAIYQGVDIPQSA